jgi:fructokinase
MLSGKKTVVGLGELLWDLFPAGKQLGGAPANFAYISSLLGENGIPASRVGQDDLGNRSSCATLANLACRRNTFSKTLLTPPEP